VMYQNIFILLRANATAVLWYFSWRCHSCSLHLFPLVFLTHYSRVVAMEIASVRNLVVAYMPQVGDKASVGRIETYNTTHRRAITEECCRCEFKWAYWI